MTRHASMVFLCHSAQRSGAEKVLLDLVAIAIRQGHCVQVACPEGALSRSLPEGAKWLQVPELGLHGQTGVRRLVALAVLASSWARAGWILRGRVRRRPESLILVNSLMATPVLRVAGLRGSWLVHDTVATVKQRAALRLAGRAISGAVAVSEPSAAALDGTGIEVRVHLNGIALPAPDLEHALVENPVVGILSALTPWKGHRLILEAVAQVPGVQLEIAGTGFGGEEWYLAELAERAARPDLRGRVRFLGHVPTYEALAGWDVCVSCSELPEAGPLCVVEAMAAGIPVVATKRAAYADPVCCDVVAADDAEALAEGIRRSVGRTASERARRIAAARVVVAERHDLAVTGPVMLDALVEAARGK